MATLAERHGEEDKIRIDLAAALAVAADAATTHATPQIIDFSTDQFGNPLANGQSLPAPGPCSNSFSISTSGSNLGAAIFDTTKGGPNASGPDKDLLVGLGNALILQDTRSSAQTTPGIFNVPNDAVSGVVRFDFVTPVTLLSLTVIDVDTPGVSVVLEDIDGLTRTYTIGVNFTFDIEANPMSDGFGVIDLTTLANQVGEGGGSVTASQSAGFNADEVVSMRVNWGTSGAIDNLIFVPAPGAASLALLGGALALKRRRM
jgi:hypothetical protein